MFGIESFFNGGNIKKTDEENVVSEEDNKITAEINTLEDKELRMKGVEIDGEIENEVNKVIQEMEQAKEIRSYSDNYINDLGMNRKMSLGDFIDFIEEYENKFDPRIRDLINIWNEKYKGEISLANPLFFFLDFVKGKGEEDGRLLNPGPERNS